MARCGCSGAICSCVFEDVDLDLFTTSVTGLGTNDSPFGIIITPDASLNQDIETYFRAGELAVAAGLLRFKFPFAATIINVTAAVAVAPTGAAILIDVNKNGTTIFTTQANRPTIAIGANGETTPAVPDVTAIAVNDYLTVDIDQVGSTVAGEELTVFVLYSRP